MTQIPTHILDRIEVAQRSGVLPAQPTRVQVLSSIGEAAYVDAALEVIAARALQADATNEDRYAALLKAARLVVEQCATPEYHGKPSAAAVSWLRSIVEETPKEVAK